MILCRILFLLQVTKINVNAVSGCKTYHQTNSRLPLIKVGNNKILWPASIDVLPTSERQDQGESGFFVVSACVKV